MVVEEEQVIQQSTFHLHIFLTRATDLAQRARRLEQEWTTLLFITIRMENAWKKGQYLFQEDLTWAMKNEEEMEYLSVIDFVVDLLICNERISRKSSVAGLGNGYMQAWRERFLVEEEGT